MIDSLTICDRCGSDACYTQEVNDKIKSYMCYGCGFITNSLMKKDEQFFEEQMEFLPELHKELMGEDEKTGMIWMPNTINIPSQGMVFADGPSANQWKWAAVKATIMSDEDKAKHKAKGKDYEYKMDMETLNHFEEGDFMEALSYIEVIPK